MKTNKKICFSLKNRWIILFSLIVFLQFGEKVSGANYVAIASGNWNNPSTWAVGGTTYPGAGDDVTIGSSFSVTVNIANAYCNNLTISTTTAKITIGANILNVNGILSGPSNSFTAAIITSTTGKLKFVGTSRALIGSNWTSATSYAAGWSCEIALTDDNQTGTISAASKIGSLTITTGKLQLGFNLFCSNLTLAGTTGTRLEVGTNIASLSGLLTGPSTNFTNDIITTSGLGKVQFTGAARTLINTWSTSYSSYWNCEVSLSSTSTLGTISSTVNFNNLTLTQGTLTLGANIYCNNLTLAGTAGTRLSLNDYTIDVSGTLNGPNTSFTNNIITTGNNGKINFSPGSGTNRTIIGTWSPGGTTSTAWDCEITLNSSQIGTSNSSVKFRNFTLTSGIFQVGSISAPKDIRIDGGNEGTGTATIASGTEMVVTGNLGLRTSQNTYCGDININGKLTIQGDYLNGNVLVNNGGILEVKTITPSFGLISNYSTSSNFTYNSGSTLQYSPEGTARLVPTGAEISQTTPDGNGLFTINNLSISSNDTVTISQSFTCNDLTINNNASLVIPPTFGLTVRGDANFISPLILQSSTDEFRPNTGTFINNGNVTGNIKMEFYYSGNGSNAGSGTSVGRGMYFSSPISNATSGLFSPSAGENILSYQDETQRKYFKIIKDDTLLTVAKGYILRSANSNLFTFTGSPNSNNSYPVGSIPSGSIPRVDDKHYYLMGNPYPSVIDWDLIDTTNNISSTIWYRTCDLSGAMVPADTYNGFLKVGTNNNGTAEVDGKIPPIQSVWIQCATDGNGSLTIPNSARSHSWGTANFIKSPAKKNKDVLRLSIFSGTYRDESIIVQSDLGQDYFDRGDSKKMLLGSAKIAEIYTLSPEKYKLSIQSVKPILNADTILLGLNVGTDGTYKFIADLSNLSPLNNVYLEDKLLNVKQNLFDNPEYTFTSTVVKDTTGSRFALLFFPVPKMVTSNPATVCSPETVDLTSPSITNGSTSGLNYTYWTDAATTIPYVTPTTALSGTYYIKGTDAVGNFTISEALTVTINPAPTIIISNPSEVVEPATVDLTSPEITLGSTEGLLYTYWTDLNATIPYSTPTTATSGDYYIKGTVESTGCYSIAGPVSVIVNPNTTDITQEIGDAISIYSFNNQIHILNPDLNSIITVYDVIGRQHFCSKSKSNHEVINRNFKPGIYIVKLVSSKNVKSKKIYIN